MSVKIEGNITAKNVRIALVISRFNDLISRKLLEGARDCVLRHDGEEKNLTEVYVPGSFEIPLAAKTLAASGKYDAVVCLGAVIRGATPHFDMVAQQVSRGIATASLETGMPVIFGVITADTIEQAIERAGTKAGNRGWDAALAALEMADVMKKLK
ncbi:MAG: 6,7-dimethyl-8-ribityllumazine synthase [Candidatus Raymondbacteria bacterium RifOxyA12_full_50_37]|uniref:6,7-dimethyl-8-ribityllumazine synthase n=1 Tax=Candidatus Raymondbacteria bacterium RIFOXYD12_FULL_49_13 TaxID=1817890 RepID=A0A1F7FGV9_UNCRA|nr:MAG: 6,7-dimethyl-8-ribityllumazine synthase [Candidatus Raymondbacteria bacterium RifOxyB12_full_50_8]OGJ91602.1 MAG: 6,7-dimethyl-8-ribityllumazine synthase [Candidatus Raymondbacteria bacterium RifOxyA12_full_50_37]OGJ92908.1 MAG: 6,7-dimethyl-8-ribityllumazine synthase [Candidatus Raymondbacteria bacterium RIFOXYA2_FULL_49_16]OGJ94834.1 MAG: 6,7-dimethyl-8-ribityllumazine synthase [Candidatus Raymondbacteria bacterium RifOxyC12_full_50_8]OGK05706.1 MAG: 6,7-dimethyl-8-ribityllumazine syn